MPSAADVQYAFGLQSPSMPSGDLLVADAPAVTVTTTPLTPTLSPISGEGGLNLANARYLGQFQRLYLLLEQETDFIIMDQHAAAERVHYERLLAKPSGAPVARQALLSPLLWDVSIAQADIVRSYLGDFDALGFTLEPFGTTTFALKEWPAALPDSRKARVFLEETVEALAAERPTDKVRIHHEIAARAACRAAIMAGDPISPPEVARLLSDLAACERPMTCPHGRPTVIRLSRDELDRRFKRI